jgi:ABC-type branched-subunit amino acid transport system ATPase component
MQVALLLAEQFVEFAAGLADDWCVIDGGMVALHERAVRELLAA